MTGNPPPGRGRERTLGRLGQPHEARQARLRDRLANTDLSSAIYGQLLVLSLLGAVDAHHANAATVLASVVGSQLVLWFGHAYADLVATQVRVGKRRGWRDVLAALVHAWPLVQAAFPTAGLMALALAGAMQASTAVSAALGVGILQLLGWGYVVGRRSGRPRRGQLLTAGLSGFLGLGVVALKVALH